MLDITLALTVGAPLARLIYIVRSDKFPEPPQMVLKTFFIGVLIFRFLKNSIGSLASVPPEIDPTDVLETSQSFLCKACGTELTVKLQSVVANEPPKHCKEEMTPIEY